MFPHSSEPIFCQQQCVASLTTRLPCYLSYYWLQTNKLLAVNICQLLEEAEHCFKNVIKPRESYQPCPIIAYETRYSIERNVNLLSSFTRNEQNSQVNRNNRIEMQLLFSALMHIFIISRTKLTGKSCT